MSDIICTKYLSRYVKIELVCNFLDEYLSECKKNLQSITVLDMCCGKGGDLLKWRNGNINHLICVDLAAVSVEQCEERYNFMKKCNARSHHHPIFSAEFIVSDCTKVIY